MSGLVKFSDAGVGAAVGRARRWLPALENLPRAREAVRQTIKIAPDEGLPDFDDEAICSVKCEAT